MGHLVILEAARRIERLRHLVYASSSSVYGANQALPFAETDRVDTPVSLYAGGTLRRDFTYIDDVVAGVLGVLDRPPDGAPPVRVLNIGNHRSELVSTLIVELEQALGRTAVVRSAPRPPADVEETFASVEAISALTGFAPATSLHEGIPRFVAWFRAWHGLN